MASLRIGLKFAILALGPGLLPGRRSSGIMIKADQPVLFENLGLADRPRNGFVWKFDHFSPL